MIKEEKVKKAIDILEIMKKNVFDDFHTYEGYNETDYNDAIKTLVNIIEFHPEIFDEKKEI